MIAPANEPSASLGNEPVIDVLADKEALAQYAAAWITQTLSASTADKLAVALSGGSTPKRLYELLASPAYRDKLPWTRVFWFFGDERFVPPDHPESNYRMVREAMFGPAGVPDDHIFAVEYADLTPQEAARRYERSLKDFYKDEHINPARPLFELQLLGLGTDGHTASLFPGVAMLKESELWVGAVIGAKPEPRITLTFPVLNSSRHAVFLVAGEEKRQPLARVLRDDPALPASAIKPTGDLRFMIDNAALEEPS